MSKEDSPVYAPFFGVMGASAAIIFSGKCYYERRIGSCIDLLYFPLFHVII